MHAVDTSVLIASLVASETFHHECLRLLETGPHATSDHGLSETFNTLTSGKIKPRFQPSDAARLISANIEDDTRVLVLPLQIRLAAFDEAESRGVRGGAIYDYLHLVAARHHGMEKIYTLNLSHFQSFWRPGDPEVMHP
jgi:predicted nucleic acid-binding protein